eukprot:TRINITY_DN19732_c0_g1_i4.p2 TRINITY_DN19732_c0_g1~~TRINITY_DN19732_c0_g1_i4.p2  ORF type:complete len:193 (-),score=-7.40 TRINITY_DN19732_c0_g1_i4:509-1087(-)
MRAFFSIAHSKNARKCKLLIFYNTVTNSMQSNIFINTYFSMNTILLKIIFRQRAIYNGQLILWHIICKKNMYNFIHKFLFLTQLFYCQIYLKYYFDSKKNKEIQAILGNYDIVSLQLVSIFYIQGNMQEMLVTCSTIFRPLLDICTHIVHVYLPILQFKLCQNFRAKQFQTNCCSQIFQRIIYMYVFLLQLF